MGVAGIDAIEVVYDSLAEAARLVLAHTHGATTAVVNHKYGAEAATATSTGLQVGWGGLWGEAGRAHCRLGARGTGAFCVRVGRPAVCVAGPVVRGWRAGTP